MNNSIGTVETELSFSVLLEYAADNDVEGFKRLVCDESEIMEVGLWYGHQRVSKKRVLEHRTPLMIAAKYGSVDVVKLILALPEVDVNFSCGPEKSTALHCAASGGSVNAVDVIKMLLHADADPTISDANGHLPVDVIVASPNFPYLKITLEELLKSNRSLCQRDLQVHTGTLRSSSPSISLLPEEGSPFTCKPNDGNGSSAKKEHPVQPSLPDIKNNIFSTDEFRMFSFKIQPCSRVYSHDWTECPFVHPGENARRRDPRRFQYSCVPCPDHRKGGCRRGDFCEYSHGIFECWLHPAQYRTRLCKDGSSCTRRVCFFAHQPEELRPLYTGADMDFTAALTLSSGSQSAVSSMSCVSFTPPMSPSANDLHSSMAWHPQSISNLQISGNSLQANHLRTSHYARDLPSEELNRVQNFELQQVQLLNELSCAFRPHHNTSSVNLSAHLNQLNSSNVDRLLSCKVSSPQRTGQLGAASVFSPTYRSAVLNQLQQQSMLSPVKTGSFSPKVFEYPLMQVPFDSSSLIMISTRINEPISPSTIACSENLHLQLGSLSSREVGANFTYNLGIGSVNPWSKQKAASGNADWSVHVDELDQLQKSYLNRNHEEEPDVSWIQSVLKESSFEPEETVEDSSANSQGQSNNHAALQAWLERLQLDQSAP